MPQSNYHFVTNWRFETQIQRVYDLLSEPVDYPRWIKGMEISVIPITPGDQTGVGRKVRFQIKGALPYRLSWEMECIEAQRPYRIVSKACGDLTGYGIWTFHQRRIWADITFDWQVTLEHPWVKPFSFLFRSFFEWNHDWVMSRWETSLRDELLRD